MSLELREVNKENLRAILRLKVAPEQEQFVASNAVSIAQAYFDRETAWFRAICEGDTPVGFVMVDIQPGKPPYLWRFMIDASHQRRGLGARARARPRPRTQPARGDRDPLQLCRCAGRPGSLLRKARIRLHRRGRRGRARDAPRPPGSLVARGAVDAELGLAPLAQRLVGEGLAPADVA